jgi:hypothetical protein
MENLDTLRPHRNDARCVRRRTESIVRDSRRERRGRRILARLWNGIIAPIAFIISLFNKAVRIYEVHNNGTLYDLGFILGAMIIFGGGAGGASSSRRSKG